MSLACLVACVGLSALTVSGALAGPVAATKSVKPVIVPQISISDTSLVQSSSGDPALTFDVTLSEATTATVTVHYQTQEDWQPSGVPGQALGVSRTGATTGQFISQSSQLLTIAKGKTEEKVVVTTLPSAPVSAAAWFTVVLSDPTGATLEDAYGTGTILPRATTAGFSVGIGDTSIREPATSSTTADLTVSFSAPAPKHFTLYAATTTPATGDFTSQSKQVSVPVGAMSADVPITIRANPSNQSSAAFVVHLTSSYGTVSRANGTVEVRSDSIASTRSGRWPGPPRVALAGDSVVAEFTDYLKPELEAEGYAVFENAAPGSGILDANECTGQEATAIVQNEDPDIVMMDNFGNYGFYPICNPAVIGMTPTFFADWKAAAINDTAIYTSKGASMYWLIGPDVSGPTWNTQIPINNTDYAQIAGDTPRVTAINSWTAFGANTPYATLRAADDAHLNAAGNTLIASIVAKVIPSVAPAAPTQVTAVPGNTSATVSWTTPASDAGSITQYIVTAYDETNSERGSQTETGASPGPVTLTGLTNGDTYTFSVTAATATGAASGSAPSSPVTPATLPAAPTGVSASRGDGSATVSWTPPADNGSGIWAYTVTAVDQTTPANGGQVAYGTSSPATVSGLTNGDTYTFDVTATNGVGTGPASVTNPVVPSRVPAAPTGVSASPGNSSATVTWTAPAANGSAISGYTVTAVDETTPANGGQVVTGTSSPATVSGLTNGDTYTFEVTATNGVGTGPASVPSVPVVPATVPDAPVGASASGSDNSATVSWTPPADNGSGIWFYAVTAVDQTTPANGGQVAYGTSSPVTVDGLTNGDTYTFEVTATNIMGTGPVSVTNPVVPSRVPDAPTGVSASPGDSSAIVTWTAPAANGSAISGYTVTAIDQTTPANGGQVVTGTSSPATVSGLTNGDTYTFEVSATNGVGTGPVSAPTSPVTPATVPNAPTGVAASPDQFSDPGTLVVSFTPGFDEGSDVTGYLVTVTDLSDPSDPSSGTVVVGSDSPIALDGLTSGDTYSFAVTAVNALGTGSPSAASTGTVSP